MGFIKVTGMSSLYRHPALPWALFKRVNTVQQAVACGGVFTSTALSGSGLGTVTVVMGETARYLARNGRVGSYAVTGNFVAKGLNTKVDSASRYTPGGQNWWSQLFHTQVCRLSPHFVDTGASGVFLAVVTKAVDGCVINTSAGTLDYNFNALAPAVVVSDTVGSSVGKRGLKAGTPAEWVGRDTYACSRNASSGGYHGYIDFGIEVRFGDLLQSRFSAWQATITNSDAREALSAAFIDEFEQWDVNGKNDERHMLKNRAYVRQDGQVTGLAPDGNYWNSVRLDTWFVCFADSIAEAWDPARMQIAASMSQASPMIPKVVATGMPVYSGFLDGTPVRAMDSLIPTRGQDAGAYPTEVSRVAAKEVADASGTVVSMFQALRGTLNYAGPVVGTGRIDYATQLNDADRLRDPLTYQKVTLSPTVDDALDTSIVMPADMGMGRQQSEARNCLAVAEMLRRTFDPLVGRVTEFDARVQAKTVGADLLDENLTFWVEATFPGRTPVLGPVKDTIILETLPT